MLGWATLRSVMTEDLPEPIGLCPYGSERVRMAAICGLLMKAGLKGRGGQGQMGL